MHCRKFAQRCVFTLVVLSLILLFLVFTTKDGAKQFCLSHSSTYLPTRPYLKSEERISNLQERCKTRPRQLWSNLSPRQKKIIAKQIIVDDNHQLLYCYIPKVACANWKRVIMVLNGRAVSSESIRKVNHQDFTFLSDFSLQEMDYRLQNYFKFLFTREPLERLVSAYKDKFLTGNRMFIDKWGSRIIKKYRNNAKNNNNIPTVDEFFRYLLNDTNLDAHWTSYVDLCKPCLISYDFIGSFDCLVRDAQILLNKLHLQDLVQFPQKQRYYTKRRTVNASLDYFLSQVPQQLTNQVVEKYAQDYELFSYPLPTL